MSTTLRQPDCKGQSKEVGQSVRVMEPTNECVATDERPKMFVQWNLLTLSSLPSGSDV